MKFLLLRFSSIGDIVLTTPVVRCLKKQVATAEIHYAVKHAYAAVVEANPYIDRLHVLSGNLDELIALLQQEDFDYVIDLHHNVRTLKVKRALGKPAFSFDKLNVQKWLLTSLGIDALPRLHIVDRYLDTLREFGVRNDGAGLDYFIPGKDQVKEDDIPASHHAGYIAFVIGAALNTKKLPLHKWEALCSRIDHPVILLGGPEDAEPGEKLRAVDPHKIYNACGRFTINESADLVRRAKLVVSHDTGLMHIAAALKKPVISVWGNTVPEFGMYPYYGDNYHANYHGWEGSSSLPFDIVEVKNLYCRPCSKIGYHSCPHGHFKCMENISVANILNLVQQRLGRASDNG